MKPRLLDLFCGAGGAAVGYARAGFDVVGVDVLPQPRYPFKFVQCEAVGFLMGLPRQSTSAGCSEHRSPQQHARSALHPHSEHHMTAIWEMYPDSQGRVFSAIHASPPCQAFSVTKALHGNEYPDFIQQTRTLLLAFGLPFIIENVVGAPLLSPVRLCGSSFGLGVRRHRLFECHGFTPLVPPCAHHLQPEPIDVTGTGGPCSLPRVGGGIHRKPRNLAHAREVMGIDWMTRPELSEAVPPAYTEHLGRQLLAAIEVAA